VRWRGSPRISANQIGITALCTGAAIAYGVAHDQVTARLCPEYFLVAHPPLCSGHSISVVAFCWGLAATWWVGLTIGVLLARLAHVGSYAAGLAGGAVLIRRTWLTSGRVRRLPILPRGGVAWARAFLLLAALGCVAWRMLE
jgi:hypothetical protein